MAKKTYVVTNTTGFGAGNPPRPLILMAGKASGAVGQSHIMVNTDSVPVHLNEKQYGFCKEAIALFKGDGMMSLEVLGAEVNAPAEEVVAPITKKSAKDEKAELKKYAFEKFGVTLEISNKGVGVLKDEIAELEEAAKKTETSEPSKGLTAEEVAQKIIEDPLLLSEDDMRAGKPMIKSLERIAGEGVDFRTADQTLIWDLVEAAQQD